MKITIFIICSLLLISTIYSQTITWSKVFGSPDSIEIAHTIKQTPDSGYICIGLSSSTYDILLMKLNEYGDVLWSKSYIDTSGQNYYINCDIEFGIDSGFVFYMSKCIDFDSIPLLVVWTNSLGDSIRSREYYIFYTHQNSYRNIPMDIDKTIDNCYVIAGKSAYGNENGFILKINNNADSLWTSFSPCEEMYFPAVAEGRDASYITALDGHPMYYRTLEKYDSLGQHQSTLCSLGSFVADIEMLADSNFIFVSSYSGPYAIVKITEDLDTIWTRPGIGYNDVAPCIDGGFVVTGSYNNDLFLAKFNTDGDSLWAGTYGGGGLDSGKCVEQTSDGGFIICGSTTSYGTGSSDFYIIKTDSLGYALGVEEDHAFIVGNKDGIIVENLFSGSVKISFVADNRNDFSLNIYDVSGREIFVPYSVSSEDGRIEILFKNMRSGSYFFRIEMVEETLEGKITVF